MSLIAGRRDRRRRQSHDERLAVEDQRQRGQPVADAGARRAEAAGRLVDSAVGRADQRAPVRSEEHTSELQSRLHLVCRLLLEKKKKKKLRNASTLKNKTSVCTTLRQRSCRQIIL